MRVLVLCKRQYTGKDLVDDRFGRLYELPAGLSAQGDDVRVCTLSYRRRSGAHAGRFEDAGVAWYSIDALPTGLVRYGAWLDEATSGWTPDVVWASSDMLQAVLAMRWSKRRGIPCVIDLYDNYESFGLSKMPGLRTAFRRACRQAAALTVVSDTLSGYVRSHYRTTCPIDVVVNGIREELFHPRDKAQARTSLGLPQAARIIGTAGALTADRGISDLFDAFERLAADDDDLWLVHAGPTDGSFGLRPHPRIVDLGMLPQECVPALLAALDVGVVCNRDSAFGRYCFPLKLHEMLAMRIPVVAAALGDVKSLLVDSPQSLYAPGDVGMLAAKIAMQLSGPSIADVVAPRWQACADVLQRTLEQVVAAR
jgi:glycosyltransferase involved in cell wall biosynthesis